jgi:hypothetical protein
MVSAADAVCTRHSYCLARFRWPFAAQMAHQPGRSDGEASSVASPNSENRALGAVEPKFRRQTVAVK